MSEWQNHVETLVRSGKIAQAAIVAQEGGVRASSAGFTISSDEQSALINAFANLNATRVNGVTVAGQKYYALDVTGSDIHAKNGEEGIVVEKTKQAVVVAVYKSPAQGWEVAFTVRNLTDYLIATGQ